KKGELSPFWMPTVLRNWASMFKCVCKGSTLVGGCSLFFGQNGENPGVGDSQGSQKYSRRGATPGENEWRIPWYRRKQRSANLHLKTTAGAGGFGPLMRSLMKI